MRRTALKIKEPNLEAFLLLIMKAEGLLNVDRPYNRLFGYGLFDGYANHPNKLVNKNGYVSTAAGAYQFLKKTWDSLKLPDFSPENQDRGAIMLIKRRGAYEDVIAGRIETAIHKCRKEWASLPGAGYGQPERSKSSLVNFFVQAKKTITGNPVAAGGGTLLLLGIGVYLIFKSK